jgi:LmbE family N-acetylglucosaminyl deacetylase
MFLIPGIIRVLVVASHPDDAEVGCGGFLWRLIHECKAYVRLLILTPGLQHWEHGRAFEEASRVREAREAAATLGIPPENVEVLQFKDCKLHLHLHGVIEQIERRLTKSPEECYDLVLTHAEADTHYDHRIASEATLAATRAYEGAVLFYQSVSTKPNGFRPTYFVSLSDDAIAAKQKALDCHASQRGKPFMRAPRTEAIARFWGFSLRHDDHCFEAFEVQKSYWW